MPHPNPSLPVEVLGLTVLHPATLSSPPPPCTQAQVHSLNAEQAELRSQMAAEVQGAATQVQVLLAAQQEAESLRGQLSAAEAAVGAAEARLAAEAQQAAAQQAEARQRLQDELVEAGALRRELQAELEGLQQEVALLRAEVEAGAAEASAGASMDLQASGWALVMEARAVEMQLAGWPWGSASAGIPRGEHWKRDMCWPCAAPHCAAQSLFQMA